MNSGKQSQSVSQRMQQLTREAQQKQADTQSKMLGFKNAQQLEDARRTLLIAASDTRGDPTKRKAAADAFVKAHKATPGAPPMTPAERAAIHACVCRASVSAPAKAPKAATAAPARPGRGRARKLAAKRPGSAFTFDAQTLARHAGGRSVALASNALGGTFSAGNAAPIPAGPGIGVLEIIGIMGQRTDEWWGVVGYDSIAESLIEFLNDSAISAVMVKLDSPGGEVAGLEEGIRRIVEARDASKKPIAVYVDELAASGGYWLASGIANAGIYAPRSGLVGSIGVYSLLIDETARLTKEGLKVTVVRDPGGKDAGNPLQPVTNVALARAQKQVRSDSQRFYDHVAKARGISAGTVRGFNAAVFGADEALTYKLIDRVATFDDAIGELNKAAAKAAKRNSR